MTTTSDLIAEARAAYKAGHWQAVLYVERLADALERESRRADEAELAWTNVVDSCAAEKAQVVRERDEARADNAALRGIDRSSTVAMVLRRLMTATEHLLHDHSCDQENYESAVDAVREAAHYADVHEADHPGADLLAELERLRAVELAYNDTSSRLDDAHSYCQSVSGALGRNVWHVVLDDAIRLRAVAEAR